VQLKTGSPTSLLRQYEEAETNEIVAPKKEMTRLFSYFIGALSVAASVIAVYAFFYAYPKVDAYASGVNAPFEFVISDPSYLCFYHVQPACTHINLHFATTTNPFELGGILMPTIASICPSHPRRFSCGVAGTPALLPYSTVTIVLKYSIHLLPPLPFPRWTSTWSIPCTLGDGGTWFCDEPM
jgi:hypothetical protein